MLAQVLDYTLEVVDFRPAQSDPLACRISAPSKVKTEKVKTARNNIFCVGISFMFIASISVHIYNTGSFLVIWHVGRPCKGTLEILHVDVFDHKVGGSALDTPKSVGQSHTRIFRVLTSWRSDDQS